MYESPDLVDKILSTDLDRLKYVLISVITSFVSSNKRGIETNEANLITECCADAKNKRISLNVSENNKLNYKARVVEKTTVPDKPPLSSENNQNIIQSNN